MIPRRRLHRTIFTLAGIYNLGFGVYSALDPQWLFRLAGMPQLNHPAIFSCLGMVVALYGILYFEVARDPDRGRLIAAVGLLGKTLGPIGMGYLILSGNWPATAAFLIVGNDLIWWIPFALYLVDSAPRRSPQS